MAEDREARINALVTSLGLTGSAVDTLVGLLDEATQDRTTRVVPTTSSDSGDPTGGDRYIDLGRLGVGVYPWGDHPENTWCRTSTSVPERPLPDVVDSYPVDISPYGVRGMAGNARDWCGDRWVRAGTTADGGRVVVPILESEPDLSNAARRIERGGDWFGGPHAARAAYRLGHEPAAATHVLGFRLARSVQPP